MSIKLHDLVIIRKDDYFRLLRLDPDKMETINGTKVSLRNALGFPYGTLFSIIGNEIEPVEASPDTAEETLAVHEFLETNLNFPETLESKDNRHISVSDDNQKLSQDDIESLRSCGTSGKEILTELVKGNVNFHKRTKFSQEKYIKKKRKRYMGLFTIEKPCARVLCELYSKLRRDKCLGLRFDTLCQLLTYSNVHAGSKVLLAETCAGLLLGAVLERIGPVSLGGRVVQFFHGSGAPRPEMYALPASAYEDQVCSVSFLDVVPLLLGKLCEDDSDNESKCTETNNVTSKSCEASDDDDQQDANPCEAGATSEPSRKKLKSSRTVSIDERAESAVHRRSVRRAKKQASYDALVGPEAIHADALIIATKFHPVDMTLLLMQFLPIGKPLVVYSQYLQPLVDLYNALKQRGGVTQLRLTDTWFRNIQVLPDRTHPEVTMLASGGYLLCAYTVEPKPNTEQLLRSGLITSTKLPGRIPC